MENTLKKLLFNDKEIIDQATNELKKVLSEPQAVSLLMHTLATSQDPCVRQYAAVILKRRYNKSSAWNRANTEEKISLKGNIIQLLVAESEKTVKKSIAQLIGTIIKYELPNRSWPEMLEFLQSSMTSNNINDKELGFYTLNILLETSPVPFLAHVQSFILLFKETLASLNDKSCPVGYLIVLCLTHFSPAVKGNKELTKVYSDILPQVLDIIKCLSTKRPDRAIETLDFLFEFAEREGMGVLSPKMKMIINTCLDLVEKDNCEEVKIKSLSFIGTLARVRVKALLKDNLLNQIVNVLFKIMCAKPEDDNLEEYFTSDPDDDTLVTCACETLDYIAMNVNPSTLMHPVMNLVKPALENQSSSPYERKASYLCLGVISQGCSSYVRSHLVEQFVVLVLRGAAEPAPVARNAALFTIGQFAEHLQPEISSRAPELLPMLISQLKEVQNKGCSGDRLGNRVDRLFYAIERFAENLEKGLTPYSGELIGATLQLASPPYHEHIRELALGAVATIAGAMKEDLIPHFDQILQVLRQYLSNHNPPKNEIQLQVEALDALAMLARSIGTHYFESLAVETVKLGLDLIATTNDPDIRKSSYGVFSSVSTVLKQNMAPMLATIVPLILNALKDGPSYTAVNKTSEDFMFPTIEDNENIEEDGKESDDDDEWEDHEYCVENDYIEEKEEACMALSELAANTGETFLPFLEASFEEVFKLLNFPNSDVRKAALEASFTFCTSYAKIMAEKSDQKNQRGAITATSLAETLVLKAVMLIRIDDDKDVVMAGMDGLSVLLKEVGPHLAGNTVICENVVSCLKDVFNARTEAQGWKEDEDDQWNIDEDLMDAAGFIVPAMAKIMTSAEFLLLFSELLPLFMVRLGKARADEDEANTIGTLAECMEPLGINIQKFISKLLPCFLNRCKSTNSDVRNNALFAIGEMALHGKESVFKHYNEILKVLSNSISSEKVGKVIDNACGVIARLIITNSALLPLDQVLPVFISKLPLREDYDEDKFIYMALLDLFQKGCMYIAPLITQVTLCTAHTLHFHNNNEETKKVIINLLRMIHTAFPQETNAALNQLPEEVIGTLKSIQT